MSNKIKRDQVIDHPWLTAGGPAFPCNPDGDTAFKGISARDYFAAKAMHAAMTNDHTWSDLGYKTKDSMDQTAILAYEMADAMLAARDQ